jgi:hypothetical protein
MIWSMKCGCEVELKLMNNGKVELEAFKDMCKRHLKNPMKISTFVCELYVAQEDKNKKEWAWDLGSEMGTL